MAFEKIVWHYGDSLFCFLAECKMSRLIPLSCPYANYEARAGWQWEKLKCGMLSQGWSRLLLKDFHSDLCEGGFKRRAKSLQQHTARSNKSGHQEEHQSHGRLSWVWWIKHGVLEMSCTMFLFSVWWTETGDRGPLYTVGVQLMSCLVSHLQATFLPDLLWAVIRKPTRGWENCFIGKQCAMMWNTFVLQQFL